VTSNAQKVAVARPAEVSTEPGRGRAGAVVGAAAAAAGAGALGVACDLPVAHAAALAAGCAVLLWACVRRSLVDGAAAMKANLRAAVAETQRIADARLMAMELSLDRIHAVLDSLREGVVVIDTVGEVVLANPAATMAFAKADTESRGRPLWEVLSSELAERARSAFEALRASGERGEQERQIRVSAIQSRDRIFDLTAVPVHSRSSGQDFGSVFLLVDVTRNHEVARLKDQFLSSISHELRTPLTNICAYAEILRGMLPGESSEWPEFVRVIHEEGLALSRLVDAVFDYLQLESGEALFTRVEIDATALVTDSVAWGKARAADRGIEFTFAVQGRPPHVFADAARLLQVCDQLLDNALKFTPVGGTVQMTISELDGCWVLRLDDSGPGVPQQHRTAVFEKLHQLADHMTEKPVGAGLGLASSRAIVGRLGGMIWCEDSPLGGASFVVLLPPIGQRQVVSSDLQTPALAGA
jgi:PAS domain S-box-containing protein